MTQKKRVILFKKQDAEDEYNGTLLKYGYTPQFIPVLDHKSANIDAIKNIFRDGPTRGLYTGLILTSQRSVQAISEALEALKNDGVLLTEKIKKDWTELPMYIVGPQTAKALKELELFDGSPSDHWVVAPRAAELVGSLIESQCQGYQLSNLLFLAGDKRRDSIPQELETANLKYNEIQCYVTCAHADLKSEMINLEVSDWMVYFSPSGLNFILSSVDCAKPKLLAASVNRATRIAAIGPTTAEYINEALNMAPDVTADKPSAQSLVNAIVHYDSLHN